MCSPSPLWRYEKTARNSHNTTRNQIPVWDSQLLLDGVCSGAARGISDGTDLHKSLNGRNGPESQPSRELKPLTELKLPVEPKAHSQTEESAAGVGQELQSLRKHVEENETARKQLVADLETWCATSNKLLRKKEDEPLILNLVPTKAASCRRASRNARFVKTRRNPKIGKTSGVTLPDFKKNIDRLTRARSDSQRGDSQSTFRVEELEEQLEGANASVAAAKTKAEKLEADNRQLIDVNIKTKAHLKEERDANKLAQHMAEELYTRIRKLEDALHTAEARAREGAAPSKDWEKIADDLKKNTPGKNADAQFSQRVKELEQQLKDANASVAAAKTKAEKLEAENREERDANKVAKHMAEELYAQIRKLQENMDKADVRARESAVQSRDWGKKAADLKKNR